MSRVRFLVIAFFIFPLLSFAAMAEPVTLTMEDAVRRALDQSIHLRRGAIDLRLAEYSAGRLWSEIFPSFSLNSSLTFLPATPLFTGGGFNYNADALGYSFNLGLSLSLNPSLRASMNRIELAFRQQLLSYEDARNQLEIRVVKDFLRLVTMQENISHMEENLQITTQTMENHRIAWETGHLNQLTWLNSQLSVQNALYELNTARGAYQNALWEFLALLGMDSDSDITLSGTVDIVPIRYDPEALILQYLPRRPDIVGQRHAIEMMELGRTVTTLSNRSPTLNFSTGWLGGSPPGNNRGLGAQFYDRITGSVTLNIPIDAWIPGTRQSQSIRAASAEVEKALLDLQHIQTSAKTEIRMIVSTLHNMWESLEIARLRVDIAERTLQAADEAFRNGAISFQEFEDRRRDLSDVRQRLLLGELNYQNLLLDLAAALNVEWRMLTQRSVNL